MAGENPQNYHSVPVGMVTFLFGGAVMFVLWWANHRWMTGVWLWFEWGMLQPLKYTVGYFKSFSPALSNDIVKTVTQSFYCPKAVADPNAVQYGTRVACQNFSQNWRMAWWVSSRVGEYWRWVLLALVSYRIYKLWSNPLKKFRGNMTVPQFLDIQSRSFKAIAPFLHKDYVNDTSEDYRPSRDPEELALAEKVVIGYQKDEDGEISREGVFQVAEAKRVLRAQLGKPLAKENFDESEKALFVLFGLRIMRKPKDAKRLFDAINESMRGGKAAELSFATKSFDAMYQEEAIQKLLVGHQYVSTALFEMLVKAVKFDGLLAPSEFLAWTKPKIRCLWYALNRAPADERLDIASFVEGLQIVCQWQAEKVAKASGMTMTGVFFDRAIMAWKEWLYKSGTIGEEVLNMNAAALETERLRLEAEQAEKERMARRTRSRFQ